MWHIVQCPKLECSNHMIVHKGTKRKKCVYCNRSFKVDDNFVNAYQEQEKAREMIQYYNKNLV